MFQGHSELSKLRPQLGETARIRGFHVLKKNCATLVRNALKAGGFKFATSLVPRSSPDFFPSINNTAAFPHPMERILNWMSKNPRNGSQQVTPLSDLQRPERDP